MTDLSTGNQFKTQSKKSGEVLSSGEKKRIVTSKDTTINH